jgi:hypothetical protein
MPDTFWTAVKAQLTELREAKSADDVLRILAPERNPYRLETPNWTGMDEAADGFFAGSGGNTTLDEALDDAGWSWVGGSAYHYAMRAPDGSVITYCEGDVYRGDKR